MKRLLWTAACLLLVLGTAAQTQQGYVKTKGRKGSNGAVVPGTRIVGATVQIKGRNAVVSQANGVFAFPIPANKFYVQNVVKQGYVVTDPEMITRQYVYSTNPLILVLETPSQHTDDKLASERKIRRTLQRQLQRREDEIEELKELNKITREQYQSALEQLYAEQESNEKLISEMAERYSQIDYDQLDDFNMRISDCILEGRLTEADSLLRSKGDITDRIAQVHKAEAIEAAEAAEIAQRQQELERSKAGTQAQKDDIAMDCYRFYEKFKLEHRNDSAAYYLDQRVKLDTTNVTWLREAGDFASEYLADYPTALNYLNRAMAVALSRQGDNSELLALCYNSLGMVYRKRGDYAQAMDCYNKAMEICTSALGNENTTTAVTHNNIGLVYEKQGQSALAQQNYLTAVDILERVLGTEHPYTATSYNNVGSFYYSQGEYDKALEYLNKSLTIREKVCGADHPDVAMSLSNLGSVYLAQGDNARALEHFNRSLSIREQALGTNHPEVAVTLGNIGYASMRQGDFASALDHFTRALAINERVLGPNHPDVAVVCNNIGMVHEYQRDYDKALEWYGKSLAIKEKALGADHPSTAASLDNLGKIYYVKGDYTRSLEHYQKAMNARERGGDNAVGLATSCDNVGTVYYRLARYQEAIDVFSRGLAIREREQGPTHLATAQSHQSIAGAYDKMGDYAMALQHYNKALQIKEQQLGDAHKGVVSLKKLIVFTEYNQALSRGKLKGFLADHCFIITVNSGENAATARGMSGEYVLLEFADWTPESEFSIVRRANELKNDPKDVVVMQDGIVKSYHFEDRLGLTFGIKSINKQEKQQINQAYQQWKTQNKQ